MTLLRRLRHAGLISLILYTIIADLSVRCQLTQKRMRAISRYRAMLLFYGCFGLGMRDFSPPHAGLCRYFSIISLPTRL